MPSLPSDVVRLVSSEASALTAAWIQKQQTPTPVEVAAAYKTILEGLVKGCHKLRGTEETNGS